VAGQDAQILAYAFQRGKGIILAVNKWDLVAEEQKNTRSYSEQVYYKLSFMEFAPLVFISAHNGSGIPKLIQAVQQVASAHQRKIQTSALNQVLKDIVAASTPPLFQGRQVKFFYATQTGIRPPTFTLFVNSPKGVAPQYQRYLVHQLREALELQGSPIRLILRPRREEGRGRKR
jgi:GTP-binding protein